MNQGFGQNACAVNGVGAEQAAAVQAIFVKCWMFSQYTSRITDFYSAVVRASQTCASGREQGALYYRSRAKKLAETA